MKTFKEICEELNSIIPIKVYDKTSSIRNGYIQLESGPPIFFGVDKAKQFYDVISKYNLQPMESIPSGVIAYYLKRINIK